MTTQRLSLAVACATLLFLAACGPKDTPDATPPTDSGTAVPAETTDAATESQAATAALPEVRYYQISDS